MENLEKEIEEKCKEHEKGLIYYCIDCKKSVCSDCAMFGGEHKGHKFEHLVKIYDQQLNDIRNESKVISEKLKEYYDLIDNMRKSIDRVQKVKDNKEEELEHVISLFKERLELQLNDKLMLLLSEKNSINEEIELLENLQKNLHKEVNEASRAEFIKKSKELMTSISEVKARPIISFSDFEVSPHF